MNALKTKLEREFGDQSQTRSITGTKQQIKGNTYMVES